LLNPPRLLDENPVRVLAVISPQISFNAVCSSLTINQRLGIIRIWRITDVNALAEYLLPSTECWIVVKVKIRNFAFEAPCDLVQRLGQKSSATFGRKNSIYRPTWAMTGLPKSNQTPNE